MRGFLLKALTLFLALSLALPNSALALRSQASAETAATVGLEEALSGREEGHFSDIVPRVVLENPGHPQDDFPAHLPDAQPTLLVTGGAGFIGFNFVRYLLATHPTYCIIVLDSYDYSSNEEPLQQLASIPEVSDRVEVVRGDVVDQEPLAQLLKRSSAVIHFAGQVHVDRSVQDAAPFFRTNVEGTRNLLQQIQQENQRRAASDQRNLRLVHISTDEVYGERQLNYAGTITEEDSLTPNSNNRYAVSKAEGDQLVQEFQEDYGIDTIILRPANNYGPFKYPEAFLPISITRYTLGLPITPSGQGQDRRDWLSTWDMARAVDAVLHRAESGAVYNVATGLQTSIFDTAQKLLEILDPQALTTNGRREQAFRFIQPARGNALDAWYPISGNKLRRELNWEPVVSFEEGLADLVAWYQTNREAWVPILASDEYQAYFQSTFGTVDLAQLRTALGQPPSGQEEGEARVDSRLIEERIAELLREGRTNPKIRVGIPPPKPLERSGIMPHDAKAVLWELSEQALRDVLGELWERALRKAPYWRQFRREVEVSTFSPERMEVGSTDYLFATLRHPLANAVDAVVRESYPGFEDVEIVVRWSVQGEEVWLQILDTGSGIAADTLPVLGRKPIKSDKADEMGSFGWHGHGLLTATSLAEGEGWRLTPTNRDDTRGAVVSLVIPLNPASSGQEEVYRQGLANKLAAHREYEHMMMTPGVRTSDNRAVVYRQSEEGSLEPEQGHWVRGDPFVEEGITVHTVKEGYALRLPADTENLVLSSTVRGAEGILALGIGQNSQDGYSELVQWFFEIPRAEPYQTPPVQPFFDSFPQLVEGLSNVHVVLLLPEDDRIAYLSPETLQQRWNERVGAATPAAAPSESPIQTITYLPIIGSWDELRTVLDASGVGLFQYLSNFRPLIGFELLAEDGADESAREAISASMIAQDTGFHTWRWDQLATEVLPWLERADPDRWDVVWDEGEPGDVIVDESEGVAERREALSLLREHVLDRQFPVGSRSTDPTEALSYALDALSSPVVGVNLSAAAILAFVAASGASAPLPALYEYLGRGGIDPDHLAQRIMLATTYMHQWIPADAEQVEAADAALAQIMQDVQAFQQQASEMDQSVFVYDPARDNPHLSIAGDQISRDRERVVEEALLAADDTAPFQKTEALERLTDLNDTHAIAFLQTRFGPEGEVDPSVRIAILDTVSSLSLSIADQRLTPQLGHSMVWASQASDLFQEVAEHDPDPEVSRHAATLLAQRAHGGLPAVPVRRPPRLRIRSGAMDVPGELQHERSPFVGSLARAIPTIQQLVESGVIQAIRFDGQPIALETDNFIDTHIALGEHLTNSAGRFERVGSMLLVTKPPSGQEEVTELYPTVGLAAPYGEGVLNLLVPLAFNPNDQTVILGAGRPALGQHGVAMAIARNAENGAEVEIPRPIREALQDDEWGFEQALFGPDGERLYLRSMREPAIGSGEYRQGRIVSYGWATGQQVGPVIALPRRVGLNDMVVDATGKLLYGLESTYHGTPRLFVFDLETGTPQEDSGFELKGITVSLNENPAKLLLHPDGQTLYVYASGYASGTSKLYPYSLTRKRRSAPAIALAEFVTPVTFPLATPPIALSADGETLYVGTFSPPAILSYDMVIGEQEGRLDDGMEAEPKFLAFDSGGVLMAVAARVNTEARAQGITIIRSEPPRTDAPARVALQIAPEPDHLPHPPSGQEELVRVLQFTQDQGIDERYREELRRLLLEEHRDDASPDELVGAILDFEVAERRTHFVPIDPQGAVAGFASITNPTATQTTLELGDFVVLPGLRGHGDVARQLQEAVVQWVERSFPWIQAINAYIRDDERAPPRERLYGRFGFRRADPQSSQLERSGIILLEKSLASGQEESGWRTLKDGLMALRTAASLDSEALQLILWGLEHHNGNVRQAAIGTVRQLLEQVGGVRFLSNPLVIEPILEGFERVFQQYPQQVTTKSIADTFLALEEHAAFHAYRERFVSFLARAPDFHKRRHFVYPRAVEVFHGLVDPLEAASRIHELAQAPPNSFSAEKIFFWLDDALDAVRSIHHWTIGANAVFANGQEPALVADLIDLYEKILDRPKDRRPAMAQRLSRVVLVTLIGLINLDRFREALVDHRARVEGYRHSDRSRLKTFATQLLLEYDVRGIVTSGQEEIAEPQLEADNAYGRWLRKVLNWPGGFTAEQQRRYLELNERGPRIEGIVQDASGNARIRVADVIVGGALKGYVQKESDRDVVPIIVDGADPAIPYPIEPTSARVDIAQKIFEEVFPEERRAELNLVVSVGKAYLRNYTSLSDELADPIYGDEDYQDGFLYLFLPVAHGDSTLIERARRETIAFISQRADADAYWDGIRDALFSKALEIEFDATRLVMKPHLRDWLLSQGANVLTPDGRIAAEQGRVNVASLNQRRREQLRLPSLAEMKEVYLAESAPELAGLEEDALAQALADPKIQTGLEERGWAKVAGGYVAEADMASAVPLVLQGGLEEPAGLPGEIPVIVADETTLAGMIDFLGKQAQRGLFNVVFSAEHFSLGEAQAALPATHPMPGSVLLHPKVRVTTQALSAALAISQQTGTLYVIRITQLTSPSWKKLLLYIQIQA